MDDSKVCTKIQRLPAARLPGAFGLLVGWASRRLESCARKAVRGAQGQRWTARSWSGHRGQCKATVFQAQHISSKMDLNGRTDDTLMGSHFFTLRASACSHCRPGKTIYGEIALLWSTCSMASLGPRWSARPVAISAPASTPLTSCRCRFPWTAPCT